MCKVNFVSEFNLLMRYSKNYGLTARERLLWIALFSIANDRATFNAQTQEYDWPEDFIPVPNGELTLQSTLDKRGIETVRNSLKQRGLIDFIPGMKNKKMPMYKLRYLSIDVGYKNVPNDVSNHAPNNDPKTAPNHAPNHAANTGPNPVPMQGNVGYKNAPNIAPINQNKDINQRSTGAGQESAAQTPRARRRAMEETDGFVKLNDRPMVEAGFVPLPWDEANI